MGEAGIGSRPRLPPHHLRPRVLLRLLVWLWAWAWAWQQVQVQAVSGSASRSQLHVSPRRLLTRPALARRRRSPPLARRALLVRVAQAAVEEEEATLMGSELADSTRGLALVVVLAVWLALALELLQRQAEGQGHGRDRLPLEPASVLHRQRGAPTQVKGQQPQLVAAVPMPVPALWSPRGTPAPALPSLAAGGRRTAVQRRARGSSSRVVQLKPKSDGVALGRVWGLRSCSSRRHHPLPTHRTRHREGRVASGQRSCKRAPLLGMGLVPCSGGPLLHLLGLRLVLDLEAGLPVRLGLQAAPPSAEPRGGRLTPSAAARMIRRTKTAEMGSIMMIRRMASIVIGRIRAWTAAASS